MPLIVFHTRRVRDSLKRREAWGADIFFLLLIAAIVGGLTNLGRQVSSPFHEKLEISLSLWALPKYTALSLGRGFAAYVLSLIFTLVYGTIAAHNQRAEKVMLPALDVLQAIPVLGFLPGLVLAMVHLFPTREMGLEIACIVMIFTAQAWNMTFSFHGSLRGIPQPLREVAAVQHLGWWKTFRLLEVPAAMIGLVWNSMMSMAGGWFFLTVNEAFTLGDHDYRLPGIGSYMNEAIGAFNPGVWATWKPILGAIVAMVIMIVAVDQLFWRPIVVWSQRFKLEDQAGETPQSWVLNILTHSRLFQWLHVIFRRREKSPSLATAGTRSAISAAAAGSIEYGTSPRRSASEWLALAFRWSVVVACILAAAWGAWVMLQLLIKLPYRYDPVNHSDWISVILALLASFVRTSSAVVIGAAWTLPVGILIGRSPVWSRRLQPIIQVVASFPAPMLFPLVTIGLAAAHVPFTAGCVALMLLGAQWYILFNVIAGASAIPHDLMEVASVYRMSRYEQWTRLYIPCVFPYLVTGLITAAGGAWNATIVSEFVTVRKDQPPLTAFGLGWLITDATNATNYPLLAASVVTMAVFVVLLNRFFWKRLYRVAEERYSLNV